MSHAHHAHCHGQHKAEPTALVANAAEYTCPMHPEVRSTRRGPCPKCGMALEPVAPTRDAAEDPELADMRWRLLFGSLLSAPLFVIAMAEMLPGVGHGGLLPAPLSGWLQLLLASPVVLWAGAPFFVRGWTSLVTRQLNMFTLIALGVGVAFAYSVAAAIAPQLFPASFRLVDGSVPTYFEAAAVITTLVLLGQVLELRARAGASRAIQSLLELAPRTARLVDTSGVESEVVLEEVTKGMRLRVRPGERIPVDGEVLEGSSHVDEAMMTGEAEAVAKGKGDTVTGGTMNGAGSFLVRADRVGAETRLAQMVRMVSEAQRSRAPIQRVADAVAAWFVPAVVVAAALTFAAWMLWGPGPAFSHALLAAVAVLIIACPCALGLATPMSIMVATGRGARSGILIRDAEALETLGNVDVIVLDKTGTLTEGKPRLVAVKALAGWDADTLLCLAAGLEQGSEHPIAGALMAAAREKHLPLDSPSDVSIRVGRGLLGTIGGRSVALGNERLLRDLGIAPSGAERWADEARADVATVVHVVVDGALAGLLALADPLRKNAAESLAALRGMGVEPVMATGDRTAPANAAARVLGITRVHAEVLPEDKGRLISSLRAQGRTVAMAGDGVNDAPALALAHVGIAMGTGTDIAMQSAGITLAGGDLGGVVRALQLSRATMRNIRQNLFFAFAYNALGIPVAAGVLYPAFGLTLSPMLASAAMSLSSVCVILNALRLGRSFPRAGRPS